MRTLLMLSIILFLSQQATAGEAQQQGRYQIVINPAMRADTFLIDTQTGRIWQKVQYEDMENEPVVWNIMDRIDGVKDFREWRKTRLSKEEAESVKNFLAKEKETAEQNQQQK